MQNHQNYDEAKQIAVEIERIEQEDMLTLTQAYSEGRKPIKYLVRPYLPANGYALMNAEPGTGKTWVALPLSASIAHGVDFLGQPVSQRKVLYVAGEYEKDNIPQRVHAILNGMNLPQSENMRILKHGIPIDTEDGLAMYEGLISRHSYGFLVLDPLVACLAQTDENDNNAVRNVMQTFCRMLAKYGCTVLILHHVPKSASKYQIANDPVVGRGASDWGGGASSVIGLIAKDGHIEMSHSKCTAHLKGDTPKLLLHVNVREDGDCDFYDSAKLEIVSTRARTAGRQKAPTKTEALSKAVVEAVYENPDREFTRKQLLDIVGESNKLVDVILANLVREGQLAKPRTGVYKAGQTQTLN